MGGSLSNGDWGTSRCAFFLYLEKDIFFLLGGTPPIWSANAAQKGAIDVPVGRVRLPKWGEAGSPDTETIKRNSP